MKEIIEGLKKLIENPDDLAEIPALIAKLEETQTQYTNQETEYQERINSLQQVNRNLLSQIPITQEQEEEQDKKVTFEQAQEQLMNAFQNVGGRN